MKVQWESYSGQFGELAAMFDEFMKGVPDKTTRKAVKKVSDQFNKVIVAHNAFDKLVEPIAPVAVKSCFESEKFAEAWKFFKEYLEEQHRIFWSSRMESINLRFLEGIAHKKEDAAIKILEAHIRLGYRQMWPLSDKQISGEDHNLPQEKPTSGFDLDAKKKDI